MGHSSYKTTLRYTKWSNELARETAEKFELELA